jgi:ABC-2 type transport system permease protein
MWFRDRQALFWTIVLPLMIMVIFGLLDFGSLGSISLGIVDEADNQASQRLIEGLEAIDTLKISRGRSLTEEKQALVDGDRDLVLVLPSTFRVSLSPAEVAVLYNPGRPQEAQVGQTIIQQALDEVAFAAAQVPRLFILKAQPVDGLDLRYIDFLVPGVVSMAIMQMGIFSVVFSFIQLRQRGILRRLLATPVRPASFLFAQVVTRLTVSIIQTAVLVGVGVLFFDVHFVGNLAAMLLLALLGGSVFISMGFAISSWARTEEVAAPVANVIAMPMMFLSGVFFPRDVMPDVLQSITNYLPLTYLADAVREISVEGATLWSQWANLAGLGVWLVLSFVVATRLFRWE